MPNNYKVDVTNLFWVYRKDSQVQKHAHEEGRRLHWPKCDYNNEDENVHVKWGSEKFTDIECNGDEVPLLFKAQLFNLSGVQPDRQKVITKGVVLKDDEWNIPLKNGLTFMMMGSAEVLPAEPVDKPVFMEDMNEAQLATALKLPPGLINIGNTCYMNATLQCLHAIPELKDSLTKYHLAQRDTQLGDTITSAMGRVFIAMDVSSTAISPILFLHILHRAFPKFAEKGEQGGFMQQDANECWTELVRTLQQQLHISAPAPAIDQADGAASSQNEKLIDQFMGGEFEVNMKCNEASEEEVSKSVEKFYQLSCFIEKEVKFMHTGLKSRLEETITKFSPTLGRDALYTKSSKISRLPAYLSIQFVRFCYKESVSINAKILKDVKFPLNFDVYDLCTEELQKKLVPMRDKFKAMEDRQLEEQGKAKYDAEYAKSLEGRKTKVEEFSFSDDSGSSNSGYYSLKAVLTHKGRTSSSGHYVAWVRYKDDDWIKFDDDKVSSTPSSEILKLSGGGDWHCAYVLLYGPRTLETIDE